MSGLLTVLDAPSARELQLLSGLTTEVYTANIINLRGDTSNYKATTYTYLDMMAAKKEHGVVMDMDVLALKRPMRTPRNLGLKTRNPGLKPRNPGLKTLWSGQMGRNKSSVLEIQANLRQHYLQQFPTSSLEVVVTQLWPNYFPRWSPGDMTAGRPWDVFRMQGSQGVWYTGSSVSFESLSAVTEYNKLLIKQMVARKI